jgi:hypothetical protein
MITIKIMIVLGEHDDNIDYGCVGWLRVGKRVTMIMIVIGREWV